MTTASPLSEEEKQWLRQFERRIEELQGRSSYASAFLDPRRLELAEAALRKNNAFSYTVYGGYAGAERNALLVFPSQHSGSLPPVKAVLVRWPQGAAQPGHRDLLGAVLGLGLRRDQVGDVVMLEEGGAAIMVLGDKAPYVEANLALVGSLAVSSSAVEPESLSLSAGEGKEIRGTVAALRLDSVLALGFGLSRSRAVLLVKGGLAAINWRPEESPSRQLREGDLVSLRNRGRLRVAAVEGETRKGRIRLKLIKFS